ncbi:MAG: hypothetical protein KGJ53_15560 [Alphaproteobacteria bacterium]|nr:hypothetical protein [Alphaproteobacteria bacterium]
MRKSVLAALGAAILGAAALAPQAQAAAQGYYKNFRVAVYITVDSTKRLADPKTREAEFDRVESQTHFDKAYLEDYRNNDFASDAQLESAKKFLESKGITVWGGITLAMSGSNGQFETFDYENPAQRAECKEAVEREARHFDHIILDDFFFYNTKSDLDIAAQGKKSWTQYRLEKMHEVARDLVIGAAKSVNPRAEVVIKYPNWYEHFQGLGFDLDKGPEMFAGIYTGTETRDPKVTDQGLQQYESYEIMRYYDNIAPGRNGGGWVDTYGTTYVDRYPEQLWDTIFGKAKQIVLFNWIAAADPQEAPKGDRSAWADMPTSFNWNDMLRSYKPTSAEDQGPGWGQVAGYALHQVDQVAGDLGNPIGIWSYKPYQSHGEDFLQNYLGNIGIPIEMTPHFPAGKKNVLLTREAGFDPQLVSEIKANLKAGGNVFITSGLLKALQNKGLENIVEWENTGRTVSLRNFYAGAGTSTRLALNDPKADNPAIPFPDIHFYTNDSWDVLRGEASDTSFPILMLNHYSKGTLYLLDIPENMGDLYKLPEAALNQIRAYMLQDFPLHIEAPDHVATFAYDNNTFVLESYRDTPTDVKVVLSGKGKKLVDVQTGRPVAEVPVEPGTQGRHWYQPPPSSDFSVKIEPHSFMVFRIE